jgi:hypothetical protein
MPQAMGKILQILEVPKGNEWRRTWVFGLIEITKL